ncbi:MAG: hypothetical protein HY716_16265 [Planctomycetes bacterium]|nr:hypothetical protein [Planctomycetota bacterium]
MSLALSAVLTLALVGAGAQDAKDAKKELKDAAKKTTGLKSYAFKGDVDSQKSAIRIGNGDDENDEEEEAKLENFGGQYQKKIGSVVKTNAAEYATADGKTVRCKSGGKWQVASDDSLRGHCPQPLHEFFSTLCSEIESAKKKGVKDKVGDVECSVYDVEFTEDGATEILKESGALGGFQLGDPEVTSDGKIWVDPEGRIIKVRASASMTGSLGGIQINLGSATWTATLSEFDSAKVEIPEKAKKALKESEKEEKEQKEPPKEE